MPMVTRRDILEKLEAWEAHKLSTVMLHRWVVELLQEPDLDYDDWIGDRQFSGAREALLELEMLDMNFVTRDDIPVFVVFLAADQEAFEAAYIRFLKALQDIDLRERKTALKDKEPYARHCRGAD